MVDYRQYSRARYTDLGEGEDGSYLVTDSPGPRDTGDDHEIGLAGGHSGKPVPVFDVLAAGLVGSIEFAGHVTNHSAIPIEQGGPAGRQRT